jgi:hypothetical protein
MAGITGMGTTFNLPNYTGELMSISPSETPFLTAIGGLNGGKAVNTYEFEWQYYDLRSTSANNTVVEGADAPTAAERVRANASNVVEIHQSAITVSYTKQAATQLKSGLNNSLTNPVTDELSFQVQQELKAMAVDVEKSFLTGTYQRPANNSTARQTRGLLSAISTNVVAAPFTTLGTGLVVNTTSDTITATAHGLAAGKGIKLANLATSTGISNGVEYYVTNPTTNAFQLAATPNGAPIDITGSNGTADVLVYSALSKALVDQLVQTVFDQGAGDLENMVFLCGSRQKLALTKAYAENGTYFAPYSEPVPSNTMGGVAISQVLTDFGQFGVMVDRWMPTNSLALVNLSVCQPVFLEIPNKGHMFVEPLARTGASDKFQLYGEVGLEYGNEVMHGQITQLA